MTKINPLYKGLNGFRIIKLLQNYGDEKLLAGYAELFLKLTKGSAHAEAAEIIGPVEAAVYKVNDYYRKLLYVKHANYDILLQIKDDVETPWKQARGEAEVSILYDFT